MLSARVVCGSASRLGLTEAVAIEGVGFEGVVSDAGERPVAVGPAGAGAPAAARLRR
jgi:hypothetical protein